MKIIVGIVLRVQSPLKFKRSTNEKIRAIAFDTAQEINTLVLVLSTYIHDNGQSNTVKNFFQQREKYKNVY